MVFLGSEGIGVTATGMAVAYSMLPVFNVTVSSLPENILIIYTGCLLKHLDIKAKFVSVKSYCTYWKFVFNVQL